MLYVEMHDNVMLQYLAQNVITITHTWRPPNNYIDDALQAMALSWQFNNWYLW